MSRVIVAVNPQLVSLDENPVTKKRDLIATHACGSPTGTVVRSGMPAADTLPPQPKPPPGVPPTRYCLVAFSLSQ